MVKSDQSTRHWNKNVMKVLRCGWMYYAYLSSIHLGFY